MNAYQVKVRASINKPGYQARTSTGLVFDKNAKDAAEQAAEKLKESFKTPEGEIATIQVLSVKSVPSSFVLMKTK